MKNVIFVTPGPVLAMVAVLGVLGGAEAVLRVAGFEREAGPVVLRFGYPNTREIAGLFEPDRRLFWRLRPSTVFDAEGPVPINAAGYRGEAAAAPKPPGASRVAILGDSVAFGARTAWPEHLARRLRASRPAERWEVLNFGVPGYSVVQGLRQFEGEVALLEPDVVVIGYGWNDHWIARGGLPDAERQMPAPVLVALVTKLSRLRLYQAMQTGLAGLTPRPASSTVRRVPPDAFANTLAALVNKARAAGARQIVLALPSGHVAGRIPSYLTDMGFVTRPEDAIVDHRAYADLARRVAAGAGARFLDLQPAFTGGAGVPDTALFGGDGIHPNEAGIERMAEVLEPVVLEAAAEPTP